MKSLIQLFLVFSFSFLFSLSKAQVTFSLVNQSYVGCSVTVSANIGLINNPSFNWVCIPAQAIISAPNSPSTTITFTASGNFTIVLNVNSPSITAFAQNTIQINPTSSFSLITSTNPSLNGYACPGSTFALTALGGNNSCFFYGPGTTSIINLPNLTFNSAQAITNIFPATYTAITNYNGCPLSKTLTVYQKSFNPILVANPTTVCASSSTLYFGGSSTINYSVMSLQPSVTTIYQGSTGTLVVNPTSSKTYQLYADSLGCVGTATCLVSVPVVSVSNGLFISSPSVCAGFSTTILLPNIGSGSGYTFTALQPTPTVVYSGSLSSIIVSPTVATVYQVVASNSLGCLTQPGPQLSATIQISPPLTIGVAQTSVATCIESNFPKYSKPVVLSATGASNYIWFPNSPTQPNNPVITVRPSSSTCYTVVGSTSNCSGTNTICLAVIPQFSISVSPLSATICSGDSQTIAVTNVSTLAVGPSSAFTYSWTDSMPISISSIFTPTVSVNPSGMATYSVQVKDANGCVSFANTATVDVKACTGIDKHNFETGFTLFPNPSMGTVFLQSKTTTKVTIELIDFSGKLLLKQLKVDLRSDEPYKIHLETIKKGIYFIRLFSDNVSTIHLKLVRD